MPARVLLLGAIGVCGGVLSGLIGIGGGIVMIPLLTGLLRFDARSASAYSLVAIVPAAVAGGLTYLAFGRASVIISAVLALAATAGSIIGARMLRTTPQLVVRMTYVAFLALALVKAILEAIGIEAPTEASTPTLSTFIATGMVGIAMGVCSGFLGVGGGLVAVPGLGLVAGLPPADARGDSLLAMAPAALAGSIVNLRSGMIRARPAAVVSLAAACGSIAGAAVSNVVSATVATVAFTAVIVIALMQQIHLLLRHRPHSVEA